jgi:hypothetical protein
MVESLYDPVMGFNSRYKPGPTIDECLAKGITKLVLQCLRVNCRRKQVVLIGDLKVSRKVPVNYFHWICNREKGGCGGDKISVSEVPPETTDPVLPVLDLTAIKPHGRRSLWEILGSAWRRGRPRCR